jgi:hypothetical protein
MEDVGLTSSVLLPKQYRLQRLVVVGRLGLVLWNLITPKLAPRCRTDTIWMNKGMLEHLGESGLGLITEVECSLRATPRARAETTEVSASVIVS